MAVLYNLKKSPLFTVDERISLLKSEISDIPGVQVESYNGLLTEFAKLRGVKYILRGVRNGDDCPYEIAMAQANRELNKDIETIILVTDPNYGYISAGLIREIAEIGYTAPLGSFDDKVLDKWVSPAVKKMLNNKYR